MERQKIFISAIDQPLGYHIVQKLRDDHLDLQHYTYIVGSVSSHQKIHDSIYKTVNFADDPSLLCRCVEECDIVIIDLNKIQKQSEYMIKMIEERGKKGQKTKVIGLSNYMTWAHSKSKIGNFQNCDKEAILEKMCEFKEREIGSYSDKEYERRTPEVSWINNYELQNGILSLSKYPQIKSYIVCRGLIYGKDYPQSLLSQLILSTYNNQNLRCYGNGQNNLPLIHIQDYLTYIDNIIRTQPSQRYFLAVQPSNISQRQLITKIKEVSGNCKEIEEIGLRNICSNQKIMSCNIKFEHSTVCCPQQWHSKSFTNYIDNNFSQLFQYYDLEIKKGILLVGKVGEQEKQQIIQSIRPHYQIYTEDDLQIDTNSNINTTTSNIKKPQTANSELKNQKLEGLIRQKCHEQYMMVLESFQLEDYEQYKLQLISMEAEERGLIYGQKEFYEFFNIPQPIKDNDSEQQEKEDKQQKSQQQQQEQQEQQNKDKQSQNNETIEIEQKKLSSINEIPTKVLSGAGIDQYMVDNVINYLTQAYITFNNQCQTRNLDSFIGILKNIYRRQVKKKTDQL